MDKQVRVFDLFSGAGGMSCGFSLAGAEVVYALESDKWAALTYRNNHPSVLMEERDIEGVTEAELEDLRDLKPDIIIGGPPCQGFSHSNINKDPKDPRNSLFQYFGKYVGVLRPALAIIENVPGLLKSKTDTGLIVLNVIKSSFEKIGYDCEWKLLDAVHFFRNGASGFLLLQGTALRPCAGSGRKKPIQTRF